MAENDEKKEKTAKIEPITKPAKAKVAVVSFPKIEMKMWKKVKPVYFCPKCDRQEDDRDILILHLLNHFPEDKREQALDFYLKE